MTVSLSEAFVVSSKSSLRLFHVFCVTECFADCLDLAAKWRLRYQK
jgi:hypothetical protein